MWTRRQAIVGGVHAGRKPAYPAPFFPRPSPRLIIQRALGGPIHRAEEIHSRTVEIGPDLVRDTLSGHDWPAQDW